MDPILVPPAVHREPTARRFDVAVIGGGIVGLATAMQLAGRVGSIIVLEAEPKLASHQTGNNSGVIHSGLYYKPGSLKAQLCSTGRDALYEFCAVHAIAHERCGKIVVATREDELPAMEELHRRGVANGLRVARLTDEQLREHEPHVAGIAGLHVAETGIVDFVGVSEAYASVIRRRGGQVRTRAALVAVRAEPGELVLETPAGAFRCRLLINCAGLQSDRVARLCGVEPRVRIIPFRGEYYTLKPSAKHLVRNLIYPVPDARFPFLGVHFTRMINGGVEAGPNAVLALARHGYDKMNFNARDCMEMAGFGGFWVMARKYWRTAAGEMWRSISKRAFVEALQRLVPAVRAEDLSPGGAGVRAQALERSGALVDDFRIIESHRMVHVLNAPSPAATASISIGRHIAGIAERQLAGGMHAC